MKFIHISTLQSYGTRGNKASSSAYINTFQSSNTEVILIPVHSVCHHDSLLCCYLFRTGSPLFLTLTYSKYLSLPAVCFHALYTLKFYQSLLATNQGILSLNKSFQKGTMLTLLEQIMCVFFVLFLGQHPCFHHLLLLITLH